MFEWLLTLPMWFAHATPPPQQDYVGVVAAEAAYAALLPDAAPVKPKVPTKDCTTCKGTGKVRQGDGHVTECPDCDPTLSAAEPELPVEKMQAAPPANPAVGFPARVLRSAQ